MATTRIIPIHLNEDKFIKQCLSNRLHYGKDPGKTDPNKSKMDASLYIQGSIHDERLLFQFNRPCPENWGHIIPSPGEITLEKANRIGYEFSEHFLKGNGFFEHLANEDLFQ